MGTVEIRVISDERKLNEAFERDFNANENPLDVVTWYERAIRPRLMREPIREDQHEQVWHVSISIGTRLPSGAEGASATLNFGLSPLVSPDFVVDQIRAAIDQVGTP